MRFEAHVEEGEAAAVRSDQGPEKGCKATTRTSGEQGQEPGVRTTTWRRKQKSQGQLRQQPETRVQVPDAPNLSYTTVK